MIRTRRALAFLAWVALAATQAGATAGTTSAHPIGTVVAVQGVIRSFAVGPKRKAWIEATWELRLQSRTRPPTTVHYTSQYAESGNPPLVFGGSRPVWVGTRGYPYLAQRVFTSGSAGGRPRPLELKTHLDGRDGGYVTALAGDVSGALYGVATVQETAHSISTGCICEFATVSGGMRAVADGSVRKLIGVPAPVLLARAGARFAMVPAANGPSPAAQPSAAADAPVQLRALPKGGVTTAFVPGGHPVALALTSRYVFALVERGTSFLVEVHDARTGALVRSVPAPSSTSMQLAAAGPQVAFHDRHSVWVVDAVTGRRTTVVTSSWQVTQVAMEGATVFWAERRKRAGAYGEETRRKDFFGRIRAAQLGAP